MSLTDMMILIIEIENEEGGQNRIDRGRRMGRLTFDEFMKLSEEERGRREVELSPHDMVAVRMNHWPTEEEKKEAE